MLEIGIKGKAESLVNEQNTAASMGSGNLEVFATPYMIALMEEASQRSVAPFLEEGQSTVGTKLSVSHDAATPLGMKVWAESLLTEIDGRRLVFEVRAFDECGPIGQGTHERFIIKKQRFLEKVEAKKV
ncbi:MAG: thioesterase family protein [Oscillospiraceae bacterium]|nr:thioesterase family protein [Oscillospiraceae bacterium]